MKTTNNTTPWQRLEQVIGASGHTTNSFAKYIGLSRGENLYQIKKGNNRISLDLARRIHNRFPKYSVAWLMWGEEDTVLADESGPVVRIPVYYDYMTLPLPPQGNSRDFLVLSASVACDAEFAVPYSDDILNPFLHGAFLLLRQHRERNPILFGNIYLVDMPGIRLFRIVKQHDLNPELLCLTTIQPSLFGDMVVPVEYISGLWLVVGAVCRMIR